MAYCNCIKGLGRSQFTECDCDRYTPQIVDYSPGANGLIFFEDENGEQPAKEVEWAYRMTSTCIRYEGEPQDRHTIYVWNYPIIRKTPKGFFIKTDMDEERFILECEDPKWPGALARRWAYRSKLHAEWSLLRRKVWAVHHNRRWLEHSEATRIFLEKRLKEWKSENTDRES